MKNILLLSTMLFLISCSKSEQIELNLKSKLGNAVYQPVQSSNPHVLMPDMVSLINSYPEGDALHAPYYTDKVIIRNSKEGYVLTSEKFTNNSKDFRMHLLNDGFELLDDSGKSTEYEKR